MVTSVYYRIPVTGKAFPELTLDDIHPEDLKRCHVWGVDPGVNEVFVAVDGSSHQDGIYGATRPRLPRLPRSAGIRVRSSSVAPDMRGRERDPQATRKRSASLPPNRSRPTTEMAQAHQVRSFSTREFFHVAGITRTNQRLKALKANATDQEEMTIAQLESNLASAKTTIPARMAMHVQSVLAALPRLFAFYGQAHQGLRFLNFQGRQRALQEMVAILCHGGQKYKPKDTTGPRPADQQDGPR
ncbi:hypothetical protein BC940DRAFT_119666 [Gongronella butleri]|nr:hypothetical protein BC940DRAFT_119666 [Gongronella butleri]